MIQQSDMDSQTSIEAELDQLTYSAYLLLLDLARPFLSSPRTLICRDEPRTFAVPTPARCRIRCGYCLFGHAAGWISNRAIGLVQVRLERRLMVQPSTAVDPNSAVRISALSRFFRIHKADDCVSPWYFACPCPTSQKRDKFVGRLRMKGDE